MSIRRTMALESIANYYAARYGLAPRSVRAAINLRAKLFFSMRHRPAEQAALLYSLFGTLEKHTKQAAKLLDFTAAPPATIQRVDPPPLADLPHGGAYQSKKERWAILHVIGELAYTSNTQYLDAIKDAERVSLFINSTGGSARQVMELCHALRGKQVEVTIDGWAASAAADLAQAGTSRSITEGSIMMVHSNIAFVHGAPADLRREADALDGYNQESIALFHRSPPELVSKWHAGGDFYFSAKEAVAVGLADVVIPKPMAILSPDLPVFENTQGDQDLEVSELAHELLSRLHGQFRDPAALARVLASFLRSTEAASETKRLGSLGCECEICRHGTASAGGTCGG